MTAIELLRERCGASESQYLMRAFRNTPEFALYESEDLAREILRSLQAKPKRPAGRDHFTKSAA
jgi:hypothetical protein